MKDRVNTAVSNFDIVFILVVAIMLPVLFYTGYRSFASEKVYLNNEATFSFNENWQYRWADSDTTGLMSLPGVAAGGSVGRTLILSNTLPYINDSYSTLFVRTSQQYMNIYINGKSIYSYGNKLKKASIAIPEVPGIL